MKRKEKYQELIKELDALLEDHVEEVSNLANAAALLHQSFDFHWTGFYLAGKDELFLGPFQGPVACTRIPFGKGVCGSSWKQKQGIVVPDVHEFPGHISCSPLSRSEIVVPLFRGNGEVHAVLDIDSVKKNDFNEEDLFFLEQFNRVISEKTGI